MERCKDKSDDWSYLMLHVELTDILSDAYIALYSDDKETADLLKEKFIALAKENEEIIDTVCDASQYCKTIFEMYFTKRV